MAVRRTDLLHLVDTLASLRLTIVCLAAAAVMLLLSLFSGFDPGRVVAVPLGGLFLNLLAALIAKPRLRNQGGILIFHIGLAAVALLAAVAQLTTLNGTVEVTQGTGFSADAAEVKAGRLHPRSLDKVLFVQGPIEAVYDTGNWLDSMRTQVQVADGRGGWREAHVEAGKPLIVDGYRFSAAGYRGFAAVMTYEGRHGPVSGAVHLPAYPMHADNQSTMFDLPDGSGQAVIWLSLARPIHDAERPWRFQVPEDATIVVDDGSRRHQLRKGESVAVGQGRLRYDQLTAWAGYGIYHDPTMPWLLAACLVAAIGLAWHAVARLREFLILQEGFSVARNDAALDRR